MSESKFSLCYKPKLPFSVLTVLPGTFPLGDVNCPGGDLGDILFGLFLFNLGLPGLCQWFHLQHDRLDVPVCLTNSDKKVGKVSMVSVV